MDATLTEILAVAGLFVLRIGLPLVILLVVGALIERAYNRRTESDT